MLARFIVRAAAATAAATASALVRMFARPELRAVSGSN